MSVIIHKNIPAGNIQNVSIQDKHIELDVEMRDSDFDWFFWQFQAEFDEPGEYFFHFRGPNKVGTRTAAISRDGGMTWQWLGAEYRIDHNNFRYVCEKPEKLIFCMGMEYLQRHFERFCSIYSSHPLLRVSELCKSPKGRSVELVSIKEGNPEFTLLLTSRHHCCEMMATYALEGILKTILADTPFAKKFRKHVAVLAVPFVDKDGVEDGDQGKNRKPHDHARDYVDTPIYPEVIAIKDLVRASKPSFVLDMHCPWIFTDCNETINIPGSSDPEIAAKEDRFSDFLQLHATAEAPYFKKDNILFGTSWNTNANFTSGKTLKHFI